MRRTEGRRQQRVEGRGRNVEFGNKSLSSDLMEISPTSDRSESTLRGILFVSGCPLILGSETRGTETSMNLVDNGYL